MERSLPCYLIHSWDIRKGYIPFQYTFVQIELCSPILILLSIVLTLLNQTYLCWKTIFTLSVVKEKMFRITDKLFECFYQVYSEVQTCYISQWSTSKRPRLFQTRHKLNYVWSLEIPLLSQYLHITFKRCKTNANACSSCRGDYYFFAASHIQTCDSALNRPCVVSTFVGIQINVITPAGVKKR